MFDIQMDGIYLDNGCLVKEAGIQPDDAFGRISTSCSAITNIS